MTDPLPGAPLDELPLNEKKQQFSLAFVHLVAAAAGCSVKPHPTDYDGVDITIVSSAQYETFYCPQFELQVKCTSESHIIRPDVMAWRMDAGPFRRLTNPKRYCAAYLGVLIVSAAPDEWLDQNESRLITRSRMFWQRATDLGRVDDDAGTKTVYLPKSNLFGVEQLRGIMKTIGDGGGV